MNKFVLAAAALALSAGAAFAENPLRVRLKALLSRSDRRPE